MMDCKKLVVKKLFQKLIVVLLIYTIINYSCLTANAVAIEPDTKAMAAELVKSKGWDTLLDPDLFIDSFARLASVNKVLTPQQVINKIKDGLDSIKLLSEDQWPYADKNNIYLIPSQIKYTAILHETTHIISMYNNQFVFNSPKTITIGSMSANSRLLEGLTDFFAYRAAREYCDQYEGEVNFQPAGIVYYTGNTCQNVGYPHEYGLAISFIYAAGSRDVEKAFFIDDAGEEFKNNFDRLNGNGKLDNIISTIDELPLYFGYSNEVAKTDKEKQNAYSKTRSLINDLVSVLEKRFIKVSDIEQVKEFKFDLDMYKKYAVKVSDSDFSRTINERLYLLESKVKTAIDQLSASPAPIPTLTPSLTSVPTPTPAATTVPSAVPTPAPRDTVAPFVPTVNSIDDNDKTMTGKVEALAIVLIKKGSTVIGSSKANASGSFTVKIPVQKAGTVLTVTAMDLAGNESRPIRLAVKDVTPPSVPVVNAIKSSTKTVTGKAEAGALMIIKSANKSIGSAVVKSDGTFTIYIGTRKTGTILYITAKDKAGNISSPRKVIVVK